jgi:hypothetical protein
MQNTDHKKSTPLSTPEIRFAPTPVPNPYLTPEEFLTPANHCVTKQDGNAVSCLVGHIPVPI